MNKAGFWLLLTTYYVLTTDHILLYVQIYSLPNIPTFHLPISNLKGRKQSHSTTPETALKGSTSQGYEHNIHTVVRID